MATSASDYRIHHLEANTVNFPCPTDFQTNAIGIHEILVSDTGDRNTVYSLNDANQTAVAWTGTLATDQAAVKAAFAGVSMQQLECTNAPCPDQEVTPVAVDCIFFADVTTPAEYNPGDLVGIAYNVGNTAYDARRVVAVGSAAEAIGVIEDVAFDKLSDSQGTVAVRLISEIYNPKHLI